MNAPIKIESIFDSQRFHELVDERLKVCQELAEKNRGLRSCVEFLGRLMAIACNDCLKSGRSIERCHYYHDARLERFDTEGAQHVCTAPKSFRLSKFRPSVFCSMVKRYFRLSRSIKPRNWLTRLALLDLTCITRLVDDHQTNSFHIAAHFQAYVLLLSELRRHGCIEWLQGRQHGAWELAPLKKIRHRLLFDRYQLLDARFETPFREFISENPEVEVVAGDLGHDIVWQSYGKPHVAIGFQGDNYPPDEQIFAALIAVCNELSIELIAYPHPRASDATRRNMATRAKVEVKRRFNDSKVLVTGFSTLGFQFALTGQPVVFVEINDRRLVFDETGLTTRFVSISEMAQAVTQFVTASPVDEAESQGVGENQP